MKKISVVGAGHVGAVTGACLAEMGNHVVLVDNDTKKIGDLANGVMPFYEPGLEELLRRNKRRLLFTTSIEEGVKKSEVIFICVGTPQKASGEADLSFVEAVSTDIARAMDGYKLVVEKSTVPVRTGGWVKQTVELNRGQNVDFDVVSNPEFLREGSAVKDFMQPDRIVIGVESERAAKIMSQLYEPLGAPILITNIETAELIKHASNSFLALKISYINAIANICELVGADVVKVAEGIGYDKRIGPAFLNAGIGYGGPCFPKDVSAFIKIAEEAGYDFELLKAVQKINDAQRDQIVKKTAKAIWNLNNKTIGILGLSFKPNTDDVREAPSIDIIEQLKEEGARVKAYDPEAINNTQKLIPDIKYCDDPYQVAEGSDALVLITEWDEFKELDFTRIKNLLRQPVIIDGRNICDPEKMKELGFTYQGVGR